MWLVAAMALILGAHRIKRTALTLPGAVLVVAAAVLVRFQTLGLTAHPGVSAVAGFLVVMGVLYLLRLLPLYAAGQSAAPRSALVSVPSGWRHDLCKLEHGARGHDHLCRWCFTIVAGLSSVEASEPARWILADVAVFARTLARFIARPVHIYLSPFWAVLWCAVAGGVMALIRYLRRLLIAGRNMLMVAVGMNLAERVFTIWGALGVATAVLWYLCGFT